MIKIKVSNAIFNNKLISSFKQVDLDDKSGALHQREKIPTNRRKNMVSNGLVTGFFSS